MYYAGFLLYAGFFGGPLPDWGWLSGGFFGGFFCLPIVFVGFGGLRPGAVRLELDVEEGCGGKAGEGGDGVGAKIAVGLRMLPKR